MRKKYVLLLFAVFFQCGILWSQGICLKVDSIRYFAVPLTLHPVLSLNAEAVRNFPQGLGRTGLILNDQEIAEFEIALNRMLDSITDHKHGSIDPRIVLDVYLEGNLAVVTIPIDQFGCYRFRNQEYNRNRTLIEWLNRYVVSSGEAGGQIKVD